jgi:hypothetical protein
MTPLLAHHLEPQHVPILLAFFAVGFWLGWHLLSRWLTRSNPS